ncbi:hypothetical protein EFW59_04239 [Bacillus subtilis]|nr:hypothetical protein EFW59_04239 [Bacillus subtilis]
MKEQQAIIEENKLQQKVTVHQFRQAQEEIQRLSKENGRFRKALRQFADMKYMALSAEYIIHRYSEYARKLLEGGGLEGR